MKFVLNHEIGEYIPMLAEGTLNQVIGRVYLICGTMEELEETQQKVRGEFVVKNEIGENILIN